MRVTESGIPVISRWWSWESPPISKSMILSGSMCRVLLPMLSEDLCLMLIPLTQWSIGFLWVVVAGHPLESLPSMHCGFKYFLLKIRLLCITWGKDNNIYLPLRTHVSLQSKAKFTESARFKISLQCFWTSLLFIFSEILDFLLFPIGKGHLSR